MLDVEVDIDDSVSPALQELIRDLDGDGVVKANEVGGRRANEAAAKYTREFRDNGGWRGSDYLDGPNRKSGEFGKNFAAGWKFQSASREGATISNNAEYYAFKVSGGRIVPKRASYLTIPMVSEAAGRRVRDYEGATGNILFRVLGKKALFEKTDNGGIRAVYALVKEAIHQPWPDALPDDESLSSAFVEGWANFIANKFEKSQ
jgi:hypothetical protein